MKPILACLTILALPLTAAEKSRTWTDLQGRELVGVLVAKTESAASVRLKSGKTVELPIAKLSEECGAYVAAADLSVTPTMTARTASLRSNSLGTKTDARSIDVALVGIAPDAGMEVVVVWLGAGPGKGGVGVWEVEARPVTSSGKLNLSTVYDGQEAKFGANFKGWAAGLRDKDGKWISQHASMEPYKRFLDALADD